MEAMELPEAAGCKVATVKGMDSLKELNIYTLIPKWTIPPVTKIIGSKRVCKRKADSTYKARIVAQGWNLARGIDCGGVFSPVFTSQNIRVPCYCGGPELGGSPVGRVNGIIQGGHRRRCLCGGGSWL